METQYKETEIGLIPEDWEIFILSDTVEVNPKRPIKKGEKVKFVSMPNLKEYDKKIQSYEYRKYSGGSRFKNGDTLVARITPSLENGKTAYVDIFKDNEIAAGSTEFIILAPKKEITTSQYTYYLSISPKVRERLIKSMTGTSGRQRVENDVFNHISIPLPPLNEQITITNFLSAIDQKIELNNQMNQTLESIGQAIFRHWFVHFEFPDENGQLYKSNGGEMVDSELGKIPVGWKVKKIKDLNLIVTDYVANGSFASLKNNVKIYEDKNYALFVRNTDLKVDFRSSRRYVDKHAYNFLSKSKLFGGEVIISNVGDVGSVFLCPFYNFPMTLGNNVIMLKSKELNNFFYYLFTADYGQYLIKTITAGSVQDKFNKTDFRNLEIILPKVEVLKKFNKISSSINQRIFENKMENESLSQLRDSLLPKLMSGKIRVPMEASND